MNKVTDPRRQPIAPLCAISKQSLAVRTERARRAAAEDALHQSRFERICARELLGEID